MRRLLLKPHCQYFATDIESGHPATTGVVSSDHSSLRMPRHAVTSFDFEVGNSLDHALHQLLH